MSTRLSTGGRLIDRARPLGFSFNGKQFKGFAGDTLAAALTSHFMAAWGPDVDELAAIAGEVSRLAKRSSVPSAIINALTLEGIDQAMRALVK